MDDHRDRSREPKVSTRARRPSRVPEVLVERPALQRARRRIRVEEMKARYARHHDLWSGEILSGGDLADWLRYEAADQTAPGPAGGDTPPAESLRA